MSHFAGSIGWLIVSLGILVSFHEFGHYWVARRCGVKVLRFSVGFGRPLLRRVADDGAEFVLGWIPLGGYVRMLDEREGPVPEALRDQAFNRKSVFQRLAIVAAGPLFNLLLCLALLWAMFIIGKPELLPFIGQTRGIAAEAGLRPDDRIIAIDGQSTPTWSHAQIALALAAADARPVQLDLLRGNGDSARIPLDLNRFAQPPSPNRALLEIGLIPRQALLPPVVGEVTPDSAAAAAGLQRGDRLLAIQEQPLRYWNDINPGVQASAGQPLQLRYKRAGMQQQTWITPRLFEDGDAQPRWVIGITAPRQSIEHDAVLRYGPLDALGAALAETWHLTRTTFGAIGRMLKGTISVKNISGPISIAEYADASAQIGLASFLAFLAMLSLNLCIINLLPIPILDGGHLLYYLIEIVKGSPVSERAMAAGQMIGMILLAGLMGLAFYNDILRLVSH